MWLPSAPAVAIGRNSKALTHRRERLALRFITRQQKPQTIMEIKQNQPPSGVETRRDFIKKTATAAAVVAAGNIFKTPVYGQSQAPSTGRVIGANDRIVVGYIGVGGQGMAHVKTQKQHASENNIAQVAVCDLSKYRQNHAKEAI